VVRILNYLSEKTGEDQNFYKLAYSFSYQRRLVFSLISCGQSPLLIGLDASLRWHDDTEINF
jgi:predicted transcriptional regulator